MRFDYTKIRKTAPEPSKAQPVQCRYNDTPGEVRAKLVRMGHDVSSLTVRPLLHEELEIMKAPDAEPGFAMWHLGANSANWQKCEDSQAALVARVAKNRKENAKNEVHNYLKDHPWNSSVEGLDEDAAEFHKEVTVAATKFGEAYPQFRADRTVESVRHNFDTVMAWISNSQLDPRAFSSWVASFEFCGKAGRLILMAEDGVCYSGQALLARQDLPDMLSPALTTAGKRDAADRKHLNSLSSEEFLNSYADPEDRRKILQGSMLDGGKHEDDLRARQNADSIKRAFTSFRSLNPTCELTEENGQKMAAWLQGHELTATVTTLGAAYRDLVEQGEIKPNESAELRHGGSRFIGTGATVQHGQPIVPAGITKDSLRKFVRSASAAEIQAKCLADPSFRKALDAGLDDN